MPCGKMMTDIENPPEGFVLVREGRTVGWVKEGFEPLLHELCGWERGWSSERGPVSGSSPEAPSPHYRGRGEVFRVPLNPSSDEYAVIRHYRRGGLVRHFLGDLYPGPSRFFREARITEKARALGIPTAEVLAVRAERVGFAFYRGDLVTRQIRESEDLGEFLRGCLESRQKPEGDLKGKISRSVAALLRKMHDCGLVHADLNVKNILLNSRHGTVKAFVIDLDRARFVEPLPESLRIRNLQRLYRSLEKQGFMGSVVSERDGIGFVRDYCRDGSTLERTLLRLLRSGSLSMRYHRFWWRLSGSSGRNREKGS
jgi:tRNA A-37 threonylcarbamoyl transferase component Bud32